MKAHIEDVEGECLNERSERKELASFLELNLGVPSRFLLSYEQKSFILCWISWSLHVKLFLLRFQEVSVLLLLQVLQLNHLQIQQDWIR